MRAACASVDGRIAASFCRDSNDSDRISSYGSVVDRARTAPCAAASRPDRARARSSPAYLSSSSAVITRLALQAPRRRRRPRTDRASDTSCRFATSAIFTECASGALLARASTSRRLLRQNARRLGETHRLVFVGEATLDDRALVARRSSSSSSPIGARRRSALSCRTVRRNSEREVNRRYGSSTPRVTRSSTSTPMYESRGRESTAALAERLTRGVQSGDDALARGLFVAGRAVDLSREEQSAQRLHLQRRVELRRRIVVVLDRVAGARHRARSRDRAPSAGSRAAPSPAATSTGR